MTEQCDNKKNVDRRVLISEEASEWFLRLQAGGVSAAERREYLQWLKRSPEHVKEMLVLGRLHRLLTRMPLSATSDLHGSEDEGSQEPDTHPADEP